MVATFHGPLPGVDGELVGLGSVRQAGMPGLAQAMAAGPRTLRRSPVTSGPSGPARATAGAGNGAC